MLKTKLLSLKHQAPEETLSEHFLKFDKIIRELEGTGCFMDEIENIRIKKPPLPDLTHATGCKNPKL
jgi:hypothetical protein